MENEMRKHIDQIKNFGKTLNESVYTESENYEMLGASISTIIGDSILKQGFNRISKKRGDKYFINEFKNGLDTHIITQVHFEGGKIQIFFKLQLEGKAKTNSTKSDIDRINAGYNALFSEIISNIKGKQENGEWKHLGIDFTVESHIDKLQ